MLTLNKGQEDVVQSAVDWFYNSSELVFQYTGAAGTGKTVVLWEILRRLNIPMSEVLPMSYTGTAAMVMRNKGMHTARTIHSTIYEPVEDIVRDANGRVQMDPYFNKPLRKTRWHKKSNLGNAKLLLIDEASMTPKSMVKDIESYGVKIIACGDLNQLPPVGDNPGYLVNGDIHYLTEVMRQDEHSGIIYLANRAINGVPIQYGIYNNAIVISEDELTPDLLTGADIILSCKNSTRDKLNTYMRTNIYGIYADLPVHGEPLICRKNNWTVQQDGINLVNGLRGRVDNNPDITSFDGKVFKFNFNIGNDTIFKDIEADYEYLSADYGTRNAIRNNPYNTTDKFELAYAITTHLSQGSQYSKGIFMEEYLNRDIMKNLIYTGITRFSDYLVYVKEKPKYF